MRLLLCTDLDRTLLPNGDQPESDFARDKFRRLVNNDEVVLAYVSGRHKEIIQQAVQQYDIPVPDFAIADVGSSIYRVTDDNWQPVQQWQQTIANDWKGKTAEDLVQLLTPVAGIELQEQEKQSNFKLSYYASLPVDEAALLKQIDQILKHSGIQGEVVWSVDDLKAVGLIDILPASAGKLHAIKFLMQSIGFDLQNTIFSGDSGNDLSVMASPLQSVLVANATDKVKQQALQLAEKEQNQNSLYIARGNFHGMNGNYAAGILEGVIHYMPEAEKWTGESK